MFGDLLGSALALLSQPAGAAAAGSVAGSAFNNVLAGFNQRAARKWEEDMYNKYNSPSALVRQYSEAGLNPALMFGGSTPAAPTDTSAAPVADNPLGSLPDLLGQLMQLNLLDEERRVKRATADKAEADAENIRIENAFKPSLLSQQLQRGKVEIDNLRAGIEKVLHEIYNIDQQSLSESYRRDLMSAQKQLAIAQSILAGKQGSLVDAQTFEQEWSNQVFRDTGNKPGTTLWALMPGIATRGSEFLSNGFKWLKDRLTSSATRDYVANSGVD